MTITPGAVEWRKPRGLSGTVYSTFYDECTKANQLLPTALDLLQQMSQRSDITRSSPTCLDIDGMMNERENNYSPLNGQTATWNLSLSNCYDHLERYDGPHVPACETRLDPQASFIDASNYEHFQQLRSYTEYAAFSVPVPSYREHQPQNLDIQQYPVHHCIYADESGLEQQRPFQLDTNATRRVTDKQRRVKLRTGLIQLRAAVGGRNDVETVNNAACRIKELEGSHIEIENLRAKVSRLQTDKLNLAKEHANEIAKLQACIKTLRKENQDPPKNHPSNAGQWQISDPSTI